MSQTQHPARETWWALATGRLADAEAQRLEGHLAVCPDCARLFDELSLARDPLVARLQRREQPVDPQATAAHVSDVAPVDVDRESAEQLLCGLLGVQWNLFGKAACERALFEWQRRRGGPLADILATQGALDAPRRKLLDGLLRKYLEQHEQDAVRSLESLSSLGSWAERLRPQLDLQLQATLNHVGTNHRFPQSGTVPSGNRSRFRILKPHARGGLGEVFVARDEELGRDVALKEIQARYGDDEESRSRFVKEAEITGQLEHPGIVPVYGLGTYADGRPYYAMRFIEGDSLQDAIQRFHDPKRRWQDAAERELEFRKLLQRFIDVCNAIEYAHSRGVLHRDLKPGNIMLGQYGETLVVDWGLAKQIGDTSADDPSSSRGATTSDESGLTQHGQILGTPAYMSPEQADGRLDDVGPTTDVYGLGTTLYALLTGQPPFVGRQIQELLENVRRGLSRDRFPSQVNTTVPTVLEAICVKAMAVRTRDRYPTIRALRNDLEAYLADERVVAHRESLLERSGRWARRHRTAVAAAAALTATGAIALVIGLFAVAAEQHETDRQRSAAVQARDDEASQRRIADEQRMLADSKRREADEARAQAVAAQKNEAEQRKLAEERSTLADLKRREADEARAQAVVAQKNEAEQRKLAEERRSLAEQKQQEAEAAQKVAKTNLELARRRLAANHFQQALAESEASRHDEAIRQLRSAVAISSTGDRESLGYRNVLFDRATGGDGSPVATLRHSSSVASVEFSPDGSRVVTSDFGTLRLWEARTGAPLGIPMKLDGTGYSLAASFNSDGSRVICCGTPGSRSNAGKLVGLWNGLTGERIGNPLQHEGHVVSVVFSPDGRTAATGSADGKIRIWNAHDATSISAPLESGATPICLAFSPDGRMLAAATENGFIRLWETNGWSPIGTPLQHPDPGTSYHDGRVIAFSPDGSRLVSGFLGSEYALIWDVAAGKMVGAAMSHGQSVSSVAVSPDGSRVMTCSGNSVRLWSLKTGYLLAAPILHDDYVNHAVFSPDGVRIVVCYGNAARLWNTVTGMPEGEPVLHENRVQAVAFSPDGMRFATAASDKTSKLWSVRRGVPAGLPMSLNHSSLSHRSVRCSLAFSADGSRLVTAGSDVDFAQLWDARTTGRVHSALKHDRGVHTIAFSPDGKKLVTSGHSMTKLWDVARGNAVGDPIGHQGRCRAMAFSAQGDRFVTGTSDGNAEIWEAENGKAVQKIKGATFDLDVVAISPDGIRLVTGSHDFARLWDTRTGLAIGATMRHQGKVASACFSADGRRIVTSSYDGVARLWDAQTCMPVGRVMRHASFVESAVFSPDGTRVATASADNTARLWDADSGLPLGSAMRHAGSVRSVAFSSDGARVVTGSDDGTARVWDAYTGVPLGLPMRHRNGVSVVAFSPDGASVATGTAGDGFTARLWDAPQARKIDDEVWEPWLEASSGQVRIDDTAEINFGYDTLSPAQLDQRWNALRNSPAFQEWLSDDARRTNVGRLDLALQALAECGERKFRDPNRMPANPGEIQPEIKYLYDPTRDFVLQAAEFHLRRVRRDELNERQVELLGVLMKCAEQIKTYGECDFDSPLFRYQGWELRKLPTFEQGRVMPSPPDPNTFANTIGQKLALIPAGVFQMNSEIGMPQPRVWLTKPFYLGVHEVTRGQFAQFVAAESYKTEAERDGGYGYDEATNKIEGSKPQYTWRNTGWLMTDDHPVVNVSWNDAQAFCAWLSKKEGKQYRLPTEAEWEYACRAGTTTKYSHGDDPEGLATIGNVADRSFRLKKPGEFDWGNKTSDGYVFSAPVGKFLPNKFGLYDMHGNVDEWCGDRYGKKHYGKTLIDPQGPSSGSQRVYRGGNWSSPPEYCESANRNGFTPDARNCYLGFRVALVP